MFGPRSLFGGLSLTRVLGGLNKTLGVVNQVIPLYKEAKPMLNNARNAINLIKEFSSSTTTKVMNNTSKNLQPIKEKINALNNVSQSVNSTFKTQKGPTFFQ